MHKSGLGSAGVLARYRGVMRAGSPALQIVKKEPSTLHLPPSTLHPHSGRVFGGSILFAGKYLAV